MDEAFSEARVMLIASFPKNKEEESGEEDADEEVNPFLSLGVQEDSSDDDPVVSLFSANSAGSSTKQVRKPPKRQWGIPDFEDQCNGNCAFELLVNEQTVVLQLEHRKYSTGSDVWDSALVLSHALPLLVVDDSWNEKTVLELGSGTGAVGLVCAKCFQAKHVILTDLPPNLELIERNRKVNNLTNVSLQALDWQDENAVQGILHAAGGAADVILGSDLFLPFAKHLLQPLARTIRDLLVLSSSEPVAWICFEERFDPSAFFQYATGYGLVVSEICHHVLHPVYKDTNIHLLRITLQ